jgi:phage protein D
VPAQIAAPVCSRIQGRFLVRTAKSKKARSRAATRKLEVLVDGKLVNSKYERENGESKKTKAAKFAIFWSVCANSVRRLSRAEAEVPAQAAAPEPASEDAPF